MQDIIDEKTLRSILSANVFRLRAEKEWSQEYLAEKVGISRVALNRIENGHTTPGGDVLYSLADSLGVSADSLRKVAENLSVKPS